MVGELGKNHDVFFVIVASQLQRVVAGMASGRPAAGDEGRSMGDGSFCRIPAVGQRNDAVAADAFEILKPKTVVCDGDGVACRGERECAGPTAYLMRTW